MKHNLQCFALWLFIGLCMTVVAADAQIDLQGSSLRFPPGDSISFVSGPSTPSIPAAPAPPPDITPLPLYVRLSAENYTVGAPVADAVWLDTSGNNHNATQSTATQKPMIESGFVRFRRDTGYPNFLVLPAPLNSATETVTMAFRMKWPDATPDAGYQFLLSAIDGTINPVFLYMVGGATHPDEKLTIHSYPNVHYYIYSSPYSFPAWDNAVHTYVFELSNASYTENRIWVDGAYYFSWTWGNTSGGAWDTTGFTIGDTGSDANYNFDGAISKVWMWRRELTDNEIASCTLWQ